MGLPLSDAEALYRCMYEHVGHNIVCVQYANGANVAIECETCNVVLIDVDCPEEDDDPQEYTGSVQHN